MVILRGWAVSYERGTPEGVVPPVRPGLGHVATYDQVYLTERINGKQNLESIHPQTRQLTFTISCYEITLTCSWVNQHLIDTFCEMKVGAT